MSLLKSSSCQHLNQLEGVWVVEMGDKRAKHSRKSKYSGQRSMAIKITALESVNGQFSVHPFPPPPTTNFYL